MNISTHTKTIKVHTLSIDDNEIVRFLDNPDEITDLLNQLLTTKAEPTNGDRPADKSAHKTKRGGARKHSRVECRYCQRSIAQGWIDKHESACPQRPPAA